MVKSCQLDIVKVFAYNERLKLKLIYQKLYTKIDIWKSFSEKLTVLVD